MATTDELNEQLSITQKLNRTIESMAKNVKGIESSWENQTHHLERLNIALNSIDVNAAVSEVSKLDSVLKKVNDSLGGIGTGSEESMQKMIKSASSAGKKASTLNGQLVKVGQSVKKVGNESTIDDISGQLDDTALSVDGLNQGFSGMIKKFKDKFPKGAAVAAAAVNGLHQGVENVVAMTSAVGGFFMTITKGAANIAISIAAIPLKIFTGLVDLAASASMGMMELMQAIENVRKSFGDLKSPTSSAIKEVHQNLEGFKATGLSAWRIFGNLAERLNYIREMAEAMGATMELTRQEWVDNGGAMLAYQKGLGLTGEQMKSVATRSIAMGKPMSSSLLDITKQTLELGKAFGISQKVIGKDMGKAFEDMRHFATLSIKEIGQASVYARKLGIELDKIVGTLDAFETFDSAAENAAKLTQSFGVTVDAFKMMEAQSPAEQVDMLKKSFAAAGVSSENFNRQQLKLLSSTTGLDEATAKQVFSMKNQGMSLDDIKKKSETAEKKQLTQAQAMSKLADSIERMVKTLEQQSGSFFDMFVKGIGRGLQSTKEFREIIHNIKRGLHSVFMVGVQLGRMLPKVFPELGKFMRLIGDFFEPKKFKELAQGVSDAIKRFFDHRNLAQAMKEIQGSFFKMFSKNGPVAMDIYRSFKDIFKFVGDVFVQAVPLIAKKVVKGLQTLTEFISDPKKFMNKAKGSQSEFGFFGNIMLEGVESLWKATKLIWPHLKKLFSVMFDKLVDFVKNSPEIKSAMTKIGMGMVALIVGPAVMQAAAGALTTMLISNAAAVGKGLVGVLGKGASAAMGGVAKVLAPLGAKIGAVLGAAAGPLLAVAIAGAAAYAGKKAIDSHFKGVKDAADEARNIQFEAVRTLSKGTNAERKKMMQKLTQEAKRLREEHDGIFGVPNEIADNIAMMEADARALGDRIKKDSKDMNAQLRKQRAERVAQEKAHQEKMQFFSATSVEDAQSKIKKLDELAAKVLDKNFDIEKTLGAVKKKFENVSFDILSKEQTFAIHETREQIDDIKSIMFSLNEATEGAKKLGTQAADDIATKGIDPALRAVKQMIDSVKEMNDALADGDLKKINISTNLKKFARGAGLGSKASYTIKSKPVNINIDLRVSMNAEDLEKSLIMRSKSVIRDRLNFATSRPNDQGDTTISNTPGEVLPVGGGAWPGE